MSEVKELQAKLVVKGFLLKEANLSFDLAEMDEAHFTPRTQHT